MIPEDANLAQVEASGDHYQVGRAIGRFAGNRINNFLEGYSGMAHLLAFDQTSAGRSLYDGMLNVNQAAYPQYVDELRGIADGADLPFRHLFLLNLRGEYREHMPSPNLKGCSDCVLINDDTAVIGHNEDGSPACQGTMYLVTARVHQRPAFTALSYPGFLLGNAFGWNSQGICFSVDNVRPRSQQLGLGRHFVARSLLDATSLPDSLSRASVGGLAAGFSFTIGSFRERKVFVVETSPHGYSLRLIRGSYFHTNHYRELDVEQDIWPSSRHRLERAIDLMESNPPADSHDLLAILSDRTNIEFPIFRSGRAPDDLRTLYTVLFNLNAGKTEIYWEDPTLNPEARFSMGLPSAE